MSLVSFDEDECLAFLEVPVTSVSMPLAELGSAAVDALITRVEGGPAGDVMITEPMELVSRASSSPAPADGRPLAGWKVACRGGLATPLRSEPRRPCRPRPAGSASPIAC